jgi:hypothetical protein
MRLLAIAVMLATYVLPAMAQGKSCNAQHPTPENPTIILGAVGGSILLWRYARGGLVK